MGRSEPPQPEARLSDNRAERPRVLRRAEDSLPPRTALRRTRRPTVRAATDHRCDQVGSTAQRASAAFAAGRCGRARTVATASNGTSEWGLAFASPKGNGDRPKAVAAEGPASSADRTTQRAHTVGHPPCGDDGDCQLADACFGGTTSPVTAHGPCHPATSSRLHEVERVELDP